MAGYLLKYKNFYRIKADYDLSTNDYIRTENGELDKSFDDFYIPCSNGGKIRHKQQKTLFYYCLSIGRFRNIIKQIYIDKVGDLGKFKIYRKSKDETITTIDIDALFTDILKMEILEYITEFDSEGEFGFKSDMIEYIAELVGAKTSGASISPFSPKNLPNKKYDIPIEDLNKYRDIINQLDKSEMIVLSQLNNRFDAVIQAKKGKLYNINAERKLSCLKGKEFVYSIGLFDEYLKFIGYEIIHHTKNKLKK
jgi:hypothetical protein